MFILGFICGFICGFFAALTLYGVVVPPREQYYTWVLKDAESWEEDPFYAILTVETPTGVRIFRGNGTVWRDIQSKRRCSTSEEAVLADLWEQAVEEGRLDE
jgi:hypothetical protein